MAERPTVGDRVLATGGGSKSAIAVGRIVKISQDPNFSAPYKVLCEDGVPRWYKESDMELVDSAAEYRHGQGSGSERTSDSEQMDVVRTDPASAGNKRKTESVEFELEWLTRCPDHVRPEPQHLTMRTMGWARGARTAPAHPPTSSHSLPVSLCACRRRAHPPCHLPPRPRASAAPPPPRPNPTPSTGCSR